MGISTKQVRLPELPVSLAVVVVILLQVSNGVDLAVLILRALIVSNGLPFWRDAASVLGAVYITGAGVSALHA
jgi:hypothetical protein